MGVLNQGSSAYDEDQDGVVENVNGTRGIEAVGADGSTLFRATSDEDGSNKLVFIPVDLSVQGETTEVDDVITGQVTVEDASGTTVYDLDAVSDNPEAVFNEVAKFPQAIQIPRHNSLSEMDSRTDLAIVNGELIFDDGT